MRYLALFLAFACALCIPLPFAAAESADADWIVITDANGLAAIADDPYGHYRLGNDIDMTGIDWTPIPFGGILDGNHCAILNLTVTKTGSTHFKTIDGNRKKYSTVGAGLFDCALNAEIYDLNLLGVYVDITTEENCFAAGLIGGASNVRITNCTLTGRVRLAQTAKMCGVGGLTGYAYADITNCDADVELVFVDRNTSVDCEEFTGALIACGHGNIKDCIVNADIFASVHGYCHNGGVLGMYTRGHAKKVKCSVTGCTVSCTISFFEHVKSRRAYAEAIIGEELSYGMTIANNQTLSFKVNETKKYDREIYPCICNAAFTETLTPSTDTRWGYTVYTCSQCSYSYKGAYQSRVS